MIETRQPLLTVDILIEESDAIVLIKRKKDPHKGKFALPGGFVEYGETVEAAAIREAKEETSLDVELTDILGVYSELTRDPRGHVTTVVFIAKPAKGELQSRDDALLASWYNLYTQDQLNLAFDHGKILKDFIKWKESRRTSWSTRNNC